MARNKRASSPGALAATPSKVRVLERKFVPQPDLHTPTKSSPITLPDRTPTPTATPYDQPSPEPVKHSLHASKERQTGDATTLRSSENGDSLSGNGRLTNETGNGAQCSSQISTSNGSGVGVLGREVKKLIMTTKKLRDLGIERFDLALPKICVVGDQSTGKSSLIEGISEIKVPRGEDTCTRCPLELILQESTSPWECRISLVKKYTYETSGMEYDAPHLGPWWDLSRPETTPFVTVYQKDQLPAWLRAAQLSILNPQEDPESFKSGRDSDDCQVPFSPNLIRLEISGPTTPNLSFFDLPGVIVQDKMHYVPQLVQALVKEYLSADNCLILYTLPMNNDIANSNTGAIIREMAAQDRTLGVVTKPDTLVRSNITQWNRILDNQAYAMGMGYFVVKNEPDPAVDHEMARQSETAFFETNSIFVNELYAFRDRFGTTKLQDFLSRKLTLQIRNHLPVIQSKIDERVSLVDRRLAELPKPPPENMVFMTQSKIMELGRLLFYHMESSTSREDFFNVWREKAEEFRNTLVNSYPDVRFETTFSRPAAAALVSTPKKMSDKPPLGPQSRNRGETIAIDSSDEESAPSKQAPTPVIVSPQKPLMDSARKPMRQKEVPRKTRELAKIFTLEDVKSRISAATRGFPGAFDPRVLERMYQESTTHWQETLTEFLDFTRTVCQNLAEKAHHEVFRQFKDTPLSGDIWQIITKIVKDTLERHRATINKLLKLELGRPLTINDDDFVERRSALEDEIVEKRCKNLMIIQLKEIQAVKKLTVEDRKVVESNVRNAHNPSKSEISALATLQAYYECVAKRFADYVHTLVVKSLFEEMRTELPASIAEALKLQERDANESLRKKAEITPDIARRRRQYEADLSALEQARAHLEELLTNGTTVEELQEEEKNTHGDANADIVGVPDGSI